MTTTPTRLTYLGGGIWGDPTPRCLCGCPTAHHTWEDAETYDVVGSGNVRLTVKRGGGWTGACNACRMCGYYEAADAA